MQAPLLIAALALVAASPTHTSIDPASGLGSYSGAPGPNGPAHGHFTLPTAQGPGAMHGRLFGPGGMPLFEVHAHVSLGAAGSFDGRIDGVLVRLAGPNPGPIAQVHGPWDLATAQTGEFRLHVFIPGDPALGIPPDEIGRIQGRFLDPNGPLPPGGAFKAHWALHP